MTGSRARMPLLALLAATGALAAALAMLSRPEAMIGAGFDVALAKARHGEAGQAAVVQPQAKAFDPRYLRPSSLGDVSSLPFIGPVKVGEHIKITGTAGEQDFEIVEVHPLPRTVLGAAGPGGQLLLVTLKADDDSGATVRLLVEQPVGPVLPTDTGRRAL